MPFPQNLLAHFGLPTGKGGNASPSGKALAPADPQNKDSEIAPDDVANAPALPQPDEAERAEVQFVNDWFRDAEARRRPVEREMVLGVLMEEGQQWFGWDDAQQRCLNLMVDGEEDRYVTINLIAPLVLKSSALSTMTRPDASCAPSTDSERDRAAAREGSAVMGHCDRRHARQVQTLKRARWSKVTGVSYLHLFWNPDAEAEVPIYGPDGQIAGKVSLPVGDVEEEVLPGYELYLDPNAREWNQVMAVGRKSVRPLSWVQERWGHAGVTGGNGEKRNGPGWYVEGDCESAHDSFTTGYLPSAGTGGGFLSGLWSGNDKRKKTAVVVRELWYRPTPLYPKGRYIVIAGGRRMTPANNPLPYRKPDTPGNWFPFVRLAYQEASTHPYGRGLVPQLAPAQVGLNRMLTRSLDHVDADKPTLLLSKAAEVNADAYERGNEVEELRGLRKVFYDNLEGEAPRWQQMLPLSSEVWKLQDTMWLYMQHIAGIHDSSFGQLPAAGTPGIVVELLQQGDKTQLGPFLQQLEQSAVEIGEWEIALYAQYAAANLPRMMGLDSSGNPQQAQMAAMAFRALTGGGSCRVLVKPGSAIPKSPAAENQQIRADFQMGLYGPIDDPASAEMAVRLMSLPRTDEVLEHLRRLRAERASGQPNPAEIERMKQEGQQRQQQALLDAQAARVAIDTDAKGKLLELASRLKVAEIQAERLLPPALSGTMDPTAVVELERRMGLQGKVPAPAAAPSSRFGGSGARPKFQKSAPQQGN